MREIILIRTTFENKEDAQKMARGLLAENLVKGAQISKLFSLFTWRGTFKEIEEFELSVFAPSSSFKSINEYIQKYHPYDVAEVVATDVVATSDEFSKWITKKDYEFEK